MTSNISKKILSVLILPLTIAGACVNSGMNASAYDVRPPINDGQYTRNQLLEMMSDELANCRDALADYLDFFPFYDYDEFKIKIPGYNDLCDKVEIAIHPTDNYDDDLLYQALNENTADANPDLWNVGKVAYNTVVNNPCVYDEHYLINVINELRDTVNKVDKAIQTVDDAMSRADEAADSSSDSEF